MNEQMTVPFLTRAMLRFGNKAKLELKLTLISDGTSEVVVRGLTQSGTISFKGRPNGSSSRKNITVQIPDIPTLVSVIPVADTVPHGEIYAALSLVVNGDVVFFLVSGLISSTKGLSWPNADLTDMIPGRGQFIERASSNPAAGALPSINTIANTMFRVHSARVTLVTDANVADRRVHFRFLGGSIGFYNVFGNVNQTASQTREYVAMPIGAIPAEEHDEKVIVPLPNELWVNGEGLFDIEVTNLQAGDDLNNLRVLTEEFFAGE